MGKKLGDASDPLLLSVRSGAKFSMPGMMNTILNLGLNDETTEGPGCQDRQPALRLRLLPPLHPDVRRSGAGNRMDASKHLRRAQKQKIKAKLDTDLTAADLKAGHRRLQEAGQKKTGKPFPQDVREQLIMRATPSSTPGGNPRPSYYRKMEKIEDRLGTACNVQAMVFGNMGDTSCTGVGFTRDPGTGEKAFYGEFLVNAQGEDVVAGIRTPQPISELEAWNAEVYNQLFEITDRWKALPRHAGFRVHRAGRQALHAADPQRQAHRSGRRPHRG
jgi:pyruvate, orthophosphate dikinase